MIQIASISVLLNDRKATRQRLDYATSPPVSFDWVHFRQLRQKARAGRVEDTASPKE